MTVKCFALYVDFVLVSDSKSHLNFLNTKIILDDQEAFNILQSHDPSDISETEAISSQTYSYIVIV